MKDLTTTFIDRLIEQGLDADYMVKKIKEMSEATKVVRGKKVPNYPLQLKAVKLWWECVREGSILEHQAPKLKKEISLEEWVFGKDWGNRQPGGQSIEKDYLPENVSVHYSPGELSSEVIPRPPINQNSEPGSISINEQAHVYDQVWRDLINWDHYNSYQMLDLKKEELLTTLTEITEYGKSVSNLPTDFFQTKDKLLAEANQRGY